MDFLKLFNNLFLALVVIVGLFLLATILPIPGNYEVRTVMSGSMEPAIHTGGVVVIKPFENYAVGDIVTFGDSGKNSNPTTHRIVESKVENDVMLYTTKGDANDVRDMGVISNAEIIGKVVTTIPFVGYAINAAQKPLGFIFLIILPISIIAVGEMRTIWLELKKMVAQKRGGRGVDIADEKS